MNEVRRIVVGLSAAEVALIIFLGGVIVSSALLLTRPAMLEALFRLPTAEQLTGVPGGPSPAPSPGRR